MIMPDKGDLVPLTTLIPGERGRVAVLGHGREGDNFVSGQRGSSKVE